MSSASEVAGELSRILGELDELQARAKESNSAVRSLHCRTTGILGEASRNGSQQLLRSCANEAQKAENQIDSARESLRLAAERIREYQEGNFVKGAAASSQSYLATFVESPLAASGLPGTSEHMEEPESLGGSLPTEASEAQATYDPSASGETFADMDSDGQENILEDALFSQAAYFDGPESDMELPDGWRCVSTDLATVKQLKLEGLLSNPRLGFRADLFTDGNGGYVVAFRGTRKKVFKDWGNDFWEYFGGNSPLYGAATRLAIRLEAMVDDPAKLHFVGHSLGGGMATVAAATMVGSTATTFNPAPVSSRRLRRFEVDPTSTIASNVTSVQADWDILGLLPGVRGKVVRVPGYTKRPVKSHKLDLMIKNIRAGLRGKVD